MLLNIIFRFMTERVTGLKFHTWRLGLGRDMTDSKKIVREGPHRALTGTLGCFQGCECICTYFLDFQLLFHDYWSHKTAVPHMEAQLGAGQARFQKVGARRSS